MLRHLLPQRSPLRANRAFSRLWTAQSLSAMGGRITRTALPVIAIETLAAGPVERALLAALGFAPAIAASALSGGHVERADKVRLMVWLDLARVGIVAAVPIATAFGLMAFGTASFWGLALVAALVSAATAVFQIADASVLPRIVAGADLVEANSRLQTTESLAELLGLAGALIAALTAPVAMAVNAATFLWSALWLRGISLRDDRDATQAAARPEKTEGVRRDFLIGWRAAIARPELRASFASSMMFALSAGFFAALYMLITLRTLNLPTEIVGLLISVGGVGALFGAGLAQALSRRLGLGGAVLASYALSALAVALVAPAVFLPDYALPLLAMQQLFGDAGMMASMVLVTSMRQRLIERDQLARATGVTQSAFNAALLASTLGAGWLAQTAGVQTATIVGVGLGLAGIAPLLSPSLLALKEAALKEEQPIAS